VGTGENNKKKQPRRGGRDGKRRKERVTVENCRTDYPTQFKWTQEKSFWLKEKLSGDLRGEWTITVQQR